jgi:hypothetical protein
VLGEGRYFDFFVNRSQFTDRVNSPTGPSHSTGGNLLMPDQSARSQKCFPPWTEMTLMGTRIVKRAIVTIQVISQGVIIIATGMILTVIGAGMYESLRTLH